MSYCNSKLWWDVKNVQNQTNSKALVQSGYQIAGLNNVSVSLDDKALVSIDSFRSYFHIPQIKCSRNIVCEYLQKSIYLNSHEKSMVFLCQYLLGIIQQDKNTLLFFSKGPSSVTQNLSNQIFYFSIITFEVSQQWPACTFAYPFLRPCFKCDCFTSSIHRITDA